MPKLTKIKLRDIKLGKLIDRPLPNGFIERVIKYKKVLAEVETSSLEETILNFQRDHHPECELEIWEWIAEHYQYGTEDRPNCSLSEKEHCYRQLLRETLGITN